MRWDEDAFFFLIVPHFQRRKMPAIAQGSFPDRMAFFSLQKTIPPSGQKSFRSPISPALPRFPVNSKKLKKKVDKEAF
jgi:hypothetical protein